MDGILIVDKPKGFTSHDIVDLIRRKFRVKRMGHAGTLDPQATGILVVLVGSYTKKSAELTEQDKEYRARLTLGMTTDTLDGQGRVVQKEKIRQLENRQIKEVFQQFVGKIEQVPPMFSAIKYKGQRLYKLARRGIVVPRPCRQVQIFKLQITEISLPHIYFTVCCSKGTYIRTLCQDIAGRLGCAGYLSQLRRVRSGPFKIRESIRLDELMKCRLSEVLRT